MRNYKPATFQPTIRPDWAGVLTYLSDKEKSEILTALFKYPSVDCKSAFWLETIKPDLDLQYSEFARLCELKSRGIRERWGKTSITPLQDQNNTSITGVQDSERESESTLSTISISRNNSYNLSTTRTRAKEFTPPTLQQVLDYAKQQNDMAGVGGFACSQQVARDFYDYYAGIGWVLPNDSRTPIVDWRPFLSKWARDPHRFQKPTGPTSHKRDINDPNNFII